MACYPDCYPTPWDMLGLRTIREPGFPEFSGQCGRQQDHPARRKPNFKTAALTTRPSFPAPRSGAVSKAIPRRSRRQVTAAEAPALRATASSEPSTSAGVRVKASSFDRGLISTSGLVFHASIGRKFRSRADMVPT